MSALMSASRLPFDSPVVGEGDDDGFGVGLLAVSAFGLSAAESPHATTRAAIIDAETAFTKVLIV
jgi:hypothetical protein